MIPPADSERQCHLWKNPSDSAVATTISNSATLSSTVIVFGANKIR
jgi:hypothetical protein